MALERVAAVFDEVGKFSMTDLPGVEKAVDIARTSASTLAESSKRGAGALVEGVTTGVAAGVSRSGELVKAASEKLKPGDK